MEDPDKFKSSSDISPGSQTLSMLIVSRTLMKSSGHSKIAIKDPYMNEDNIFIDKAKC